MQHNITSKVKKSYVPVRSNFRKVTKLRYFCVQLLSSIIHLQEFLSYEIQKPNEKIYNSLSNDCGIYNNSRIYQNTKLNLLLSSFSSSASFLKQHISPRHPVSTQGLSYSNVPLKKSPGSLWMEKVSDILDYCIMSFRNPVILHIFEGIAYGREVTSTKTQEGGMP